MSVTVTTPSHYCVDRLHRGIADLREMFPAGEANSLNFALFSTSGIHGSYATIEEVEASLDLDLLQPPEKLTVLVIQPRICALRYGAIEVSKEDVPFLKKLRASSKRVFAEHP